MYNQTYSLSTKLLWHRRGSKTPKQTIATMKSAKKELKRAMRTVKIEDIYSMQEEMMDLLDVSDEIQESIGISATISKMTLTRKN